jgi:hypothetical protein
MRGMLLLWGSMQIHLKWQKPMGVTDRQHKSSRGSGRKWFWGNRLWHDGQTFRCNELAVARFAGGGREQIPLDFPGQYGITVS